jgi:hypothetical protein
MLRAHGRGNCVGVLTSSPSLQTRFAGSSHHRKSYSIELIATDYEHLRAESQQQN